MSASSQTVCYWSKRWVERVRPGRREAHPAITEFNQEDFEMFFRLVRRPETSVRPQPPSPRSPQFPVASCLVKIHSSQVKTGFLRAHGPSDGATSRSKRGCGRTMYFKICGILNACKSQTALLVMCVLQSHMLFEDNFIRGGSYILQCFTFYIRDSGTVQIYCFCNPN